MLPALATILAGFTAATLALQGAPTGVPATTPPPKERIRPPNEIYKPSKQDSRNPDQWEAQPKQPATPPNPGPGTPPPAAPGTADPAGTGAGSPAQPAAPDGTQPSAGDASTAAGGGAVTPIAPPRGLGAGAAPATGTSNKDLIILAVVAVAVLVPLVLGVWWIFSDNPIVKRYGDQP